MKKNLLIISLIVVCLHSKAIFGMNKDIAQLAVVIQRPQKHQNEMGHPNGYLHKLLTSDDKLILECISYSENIPQGFLEVALDENKNLKSDWKHRITMLPWW